MYALHIIMKKIANENNCKHCGENKINTGLKEDSNIETYSYMI